MPVVLQALERGGAAVSRVRKVWASLPAGLNQRLAEEGDWALREWERRLAEAE